MALNLINTFWKLTFLDVFIIMAALLATMCSPIFSSGTDTGTVVWEPQNAYATLENQALFTQGFYNEMRYFCECVLENRPAEEGTLEFAHTIMKIYEAGIMSEGARIQLT